METCVKFLVTFFIAITLEVSLPCRDVHQTEQRSLQRCQVVEIGSIRDIQFPHGSLSQCTTYSFYSARSRTGKEILSLSSAFSAAHIL